MPYCMRLTSYADIVIIAKSNTLVGASIRMQLLMAEIRVKFVV